MRPFAALILSLLACALLASGASAQACVGLPSFDGRPLRLNVAGEFPDSAKAYAVGVGLGKPSGLFGNAGAGQVTYEGLAERATLGFLELGLQLPMGPVELCPLVGGYYAVGPNDPTLGLEVETRGGTAGAAVGLPLDVGFGSVIPNAGVRWEYVSQRVEEEGFDPATFRLDSRVLDLGVALVFGGRFSVQPILHIPFGQEEGEGEGSSVGVFASLGLGLPR
jgi:hypothetical protein